jgi:chromosome segregation ATPase
MTEYHRYSPLLERVLEAQTADTIDGPTYNLLADLRDAINESERRNKKLEAEANKALETADRSGEAAAEANEALHVANHKINVWEQKVDRQIAVLKRQDKHISELHVAIETALVSIASTETVEELHFGIVAAREHLRHALRWNVVEPPEDETLLQRHARLYDEYKATDDRMAALSEDMTAWLDIRRDIVRQEVELGDALKGRSVRVVSVLSEFKGLTGFIEGFHGGEIRVAIKMPDSHSSIEPFIYFHPDALELEN